MEMAIFQHPKPQLYLEARAWLEVYVEVNAESSPMKFEYYLPAGRKCYYFEQMAYERTREGKICCSLKSFLEMWRTELPFVRICGSVCKFVKCGCCEYLRMQIDLTPRSDAVLINALRSRLGEHFQFQSAQRLVVGREEERCIQSGGDDVFYHKDKMDQQKCILPCVWPLLSTPLFKGGDRLVVGIVGGLFRGAVNTEMIVRSVFQDHQHGSNMQASAALLDIHSSAMKEGRLPNKYSMGADNTYKETKNQYFLGFVVWLLCLLFDTNLWCFELFFLLVGHTHGALDRFFSHLATVLIGKTYLTLHDMYKIFETELQRFNIRCEHQHTVWDFKALKEHFKWPSISGLGHVHGIKVYRSNGVWIQWRQYLTDASWSKPVLLVPPHMVRSVAAYRPSLVPMEFTEKRRCTSGPMNLNLF